MCFLLSFSFPILAMWFPHAAGFFQRFSALCELLLSLPAPEPRGAAAGASTGQFGRAKEGTGRACLGAEKQRLSRVGWEQSYVRLRCA